MSRKKPAIEEIIENDVAALRESKRIKKDELAEIQKELRRYEAALKSLTGKASARKRKNKEENGGLS
jgi:hypothetical protein